MPVRVDSRLKRFLELCRASGFDGAIVVPGPNMRYLLDFTLEVFERPAFLLAGFDREPVMVVPQLDRDRVEEAIGRYCEVLPYGDGTGPWGFVERLLSGLSGVIGVESRTPVWLYRNLVQRAPGLKFDIVDHVIVSMRLPKDPDEVVRHVMAARVLEEAMLETMAEFRPGMTERDAMTTFLRRCYDLGAESVYCLIQSGPNGANPHLEPTSRRIREGDAIVFDASVCYRGYYADFTRTFVLDRPDPEQERVFSVVLEAQQRALDAIAVGVSAEEVDRAARSVIAHEGYASFFIHRTGHGLGVEVHEAPYIVEGDKSPLVSGMIFTIEPGIYLPGKFGVRLEDDVVLGSTGYENTTKLPKALSSASL
ncbi:MAG: Xaa-Pro peptidase family protein [Nitrososphaerota archaeon]|nr:Xaa-Pro peptidase family protein [Nitrososphaerota archaeon]